MQIPKRLLISTLIGIALSASAQAEITRINLEKSSLDLRVDTPVARSTAPQSSIYIVQLKGKPVLSYEGDIKGYSATKPGKGKKVNPKSAHVKKYVGLLEENQKEAIQSVGAEKVYNYSYSLNGFAARMTPEQAEALKKKNNVINVWEDEIHQLHTDNSPTYIGLTEGGDLWSKGYTGEDVVIGVIDTGIWPEHPSFADVRTPKKGNKGKLVSYGRPPSDFTSSGCDFGNTDANPTDADFSCNNKLVTARCYNFGFSSAPDASNPCGGDGIEVSPSEFQSARDADGHGSHTASTAGGNNGVPAVIDGTPMGSISGIAPRARLAVYKVCWDGNDGGCASSDSMAAIDQAVADGVDVINYSIGGSNTNFGGPNELAFLFADDAGVFVATSNGNAGPGASTVGTPSGVPWITAVGASQDNDTTYNIAIVHAPAEVAGEVVAVEGSSEVQLADTGAITDGLTLTSPADGCTPLVSPIPNIALTIRGGCAFSTKYNNAAAAGASAIIVYNDGTAADRMDPIGMDAPGTSIPGVMIGYEDGNALANASGVNVTLDENNTISAVNRVADFSSRGPNAGAPDIIKPDISAPGVSILAAVTPAAGGELFANYNGTSMASPHVAGAFALLKQAHPDWSHAVARSALMTNARQGLKKSFGDAEADPFDIGAGEILPSAAFDPGLAYNADIYDYLAFSCENNFNFSEYLGLPCDLLVYYGYSTDASDLNLPSIGVAELAGSQTITRTVTNVANNKGKMSFTVSVDAPPGVDVSVSPSQVKLKPGESATYEVTLAVTDAAALDEWTFGSLTWSHAAKYSVRSPIAVKPVAFSAAAEVDGVADATTGDGSVDVEVSFGYTGPYAASVSGLLESLPVSSTLAPEGYDAWCLDLPANTHVRFATFDADTTVPGADDIDLDAYLLNADCDTSTAIIADLGASGGATSEEVIDVSNGPAGAYLVYVDYYAAANPGDNIDYTLWAQPVFGDEGNTTVSAPASAILGTTGTTTVSYSGLTSGSRYLGVLHHEDGSGEVTRTILDIDTQ